MMAIGRKRSFIITGLLTAALAAGLLLGGCARGGEEEPIVPSRVVEFFVTFAAPIQDAFYYYMVIDADGDFGADGPLPVAAGPNWGNGWGTGSFTHYVEYHLGRYELYRATLQPQLARAGGGITAISGTPLSTDAGLHTITVNSLSLGAATVAGAGAVASVTNTGFQAAGTLALRTNAAGEVVAGSVSWTPAAAGGRALTVAEQAALTTLNSGVALNPASLAPLGLTLVLAPGAALPIWG